MPNIDAILDRLPWFGYRRAVRRRLEFVKALLPRRGKESLPQSSQPPTRETQVFEISARCLPASGQTVYVWRSPAVR